MGCGRWDHGCIAKNHTYHINSILHYLSCISEAVFVDQRVPVGTHTAAHSSNLADQYNSNMRKVLMILGDFVEDYEVKYL